jgi:hypothetical protein
MQQQESAGYFVGSERAGACGRTASAPGVGRRCMSARMTPRDQGIRDRPDIKDRSWERGIEDWLVGDASCFMRHASCFMLMLMLMLMLAFNR